MKLKFRFLLFVSIVLCMIGCDNGKIEPEPYPTPTQALKTTATPEPTRPLSFEEEKILREEERLTLLASPTPGPEPYVLLGTDKEVKIGDVVTMGEYCHNKYSHGSYYTKFPIKWLVFGKRR